MDKKKLIIISSAIVILCVIIGVFQHFYNSSKNTNETTVNSSIASSEQESENDEKQTELTTQNETEITNENKSEKNNTNNSNKNNGNNVTTTIKNQKPSADSFPQQNNNSAENKPNHNSSNNNTTEKKEITVTLTISCKNALKYNVNVPSNGYFLNSTRYTFKNGVNVYTVLSSACKENGISLDYDGSYVSGIGGLREKQCTDESGWMYRVNGKLPPKSMNNYVLKDGDKIEVYYVTSYTDMP